MSVRRAELAALRSAGWEVQTYTFAERLRALLGRRKPVGRPWPASPVPEWPPVGRWSA